MAGSDQSGISPAGTAGPKTSARWPCLRAILLQMARTQQIVACNAASRQSPSEMRSSHTSCSDPDSAEEQYGRNLPAYPLSQEILGWPCQLAKATPSRSQATPTTCACSNHQAWREGIWLSKVAPEETKLSQEPAARGRQPVSSVKPRRWAFIGVSSL